MKMTRLFTKHLLTYMSMFTTTYCVGDDEATLVNGERMADDGRGRNRPRIERKLENDVENLVPSDELTWVVMVFGFYSFDYSNPLCFGALVTAADVVTTCSCVKAALENPTAYLMVKPKASIVEWDDDYRMVINVLIHEHCKNCSATTYNNVAILTIEAMIIMNGLVGVVPRLENLPTHLTWEESYGDCYILGLVTGDFTPHLGSLEIKKIPFTVWDTQSPQNEFGTRTFFGNSTKYGDSIFLYEQRFPGSPLICHANHKPFIIGLHLGIYCPPYVDITKDFIRQNCSKPVTECDDCVPLTDPSSHFADCYETNTYEAVMRFTSLYEWIKENIFEPVDEAAVFHFRPSSKSSIIFESLKVLYTTVVLVKILF